MKFTLFATQSVMPLIVTTGSIKTIITDWTGFPNKRYNALFHLPGCLDTQSSDPYFRNARCM